MSFLESWGKIGQYVLEWKFCIWRFNLVWLDFDLTLTSRCVGTKNECFLQILRPKWPIKYASQQNSHNIFVWLNRWGFTQAFKTMRFLLVWCSYVHPGADISWYIQQIKITPVYCICLVGVHSRATFCRSPFVWTSWKVWNILWCRHTFSLKSNVMQKYVPYYRPTQKQDIVSFH